MKTRPQRSGLWVKLDTCHHRQEKCIVEGRLGNSSAVRLTFPSKRPSVALPCWVMTALRILSPEVTSGAQWGTSISLPRPSSLCFFSAERSPESNPNHNFYSHFMLLNLSDPQFYHLYNETANRTYSFGPG